MERQDPDDDALLDEDPTLPQGGARNRVLADTELERAFVKAIESDGLGMTGSSPGFFACFVRPVALLLARTDRTEEH